MDLDLTAWGFDPPEPPWSEFNRDWRAGRRVLRKALSRYLADSGLSEEQLAQRLKLSRIPATPREVCAWLEGYPPPADAFLAIAAMRDQATSALVDRLLHLQPRD